MVALLNVSDFKIRKSPALLYRLLLHCNPWKNKIIIKGMNIHSSTDDFQMWGYVAFVGILETVYNPFLLGETKLNKKNRSNIEVSLSGMPSQAEQNAIAIFVAIIFKVFAKTFKNKLIYRKNVICFFFLNYNYIGITQNLRS